MTALTDIRGAIARARADRRPMVMGTRRIHIEVGPVAARSLMCDFEGRVPAEIDGVTVYATQAFPGYDVVVR